jgi:hypothetical protein
MGQPEQREASQVGLFERLEREKSEFLDAVRKVVRAELDAFAAEHVLDQQLLYSRPQAAAMLGISEASIHVLIQRGMLKFRKFGSRRLFAHEELVRLAKRDIANIWPEKIAGEDGKRRTTRKPISIARRAS